MGGWTLDDIAWHRFDAAKLDPDLVRIVKAAALVEHNGADYAGHLCRIFADDADFQDAVRRWGADEERHGAALGRWAALADPTFDFAAAAARFRDGYRIDFTAPRSRRGSRTGEMVARCVVETGTSSYYAALREAAAEPVLKEICRRIAGDEIRHYRLFYKHLERCLEHERFGRFARLRVAFGRIAETGDDELAYAYFAANETGRPYDRRRCARAYAGRAFALYRPHHVARGVAMLLRAAGLKPSGRLGRLARGVAWRAVRWRAARLADAGAAA